MGIVSGPPIHKRLRLNQTRDDFGEIGLRRSTSPKSTGVVIAREVVNGNSSGPSIHNSAALSNARPISEKSVYVGRLLRSRPEWLSPGSGNGNS